jgi:quinoprotein dehydrogenase-associated probable ABC transporter substrate-binding protein
METNMASKLKIVFSALGLLVSNLAVADNQTPALRICADPGNMPLSNTMGEGFHNKIAEVLAESMGTQVSYAYRPYLERGLTRQTFKNNRCDILMDMSPDNERMITTSPVYRSTFVLATRAGAGYDFTSLNDPKLKQLRIGVFQHSAIRTELMEHGLSSKVKVHTISHNADLKPERQPTKQVQSVIDGELDVAGAWGPLAGWYNTNGKQQLDLYYMNQFETVLPMEFELAIGLKRSDVALRDQLNAVLVKEKDKIKDILVSFGVPLVECETCIVSGDLPAHGPYKQPKHIVAKFQPSKQSPMQELPEMINRALKGGSTLDNELLNAVLAKDLTRVQYVIDRGANIDTQDANGLTPLMNAIKGGHLPLVKLLLKNSSNPNALDNDGWTAAMHAAWQNEPKMIRSLAGVGADFEKVEKLTGSTALILAVQKGHAISVVALVDSGANPDFKVGEGYTALMIAAKKGELTSAQALLQYGADVNATNKGGVTALMIAAANNKSNLVSLLLKSGAKTDKKDGMGETAMDIAKARKATEALVMLERLTANTSN